MAADVAPAELMAIAMAREVVDGDFAGVGAAGHVPFAAMRLAQLSHAPNATFFSGGSGAVNPAPKTLHSTSSDFRNLLMGEALIPMEDVVDFEMSMRFDLGFFGGMQIDKYGNVNMAVIGDWEKPKVRGPGTVGTIFMGGFKRVFLFTYNHSRRTELAWTKYNDTRPASVEPETRNLKPETQTPTSSPTTAVKPDGAALCDKESHDAKPAFDPVKRIYNTRCCHEPCQICHAPDSEYPLDEVHRDEQFYKKHRKNPYDRHGRSRHLIETYCDCSCNRCAEKNSANQEPPPLTAAHNTESRNTEHATRDPIIRHEPPPSDENPSAPQPTISPVSPQGPIPINSQPPPLPYDSIAASLRRISLIEARIQRNHTL